LPNDRDRRVDITGRDRVALLRHRAARASARREWFVNFAHFSLHHQLYVHRKLSERAADEAEEAPDFGDRVADRVPRDERLREPKLLHEALLCLNRALLDRGEHPRT